MTAPSTQDLREGLDALQEDMADHQRSIAREPTGEANRVLAAAEFEKLEKQLLAQAPAPPAAAPAVDAKPARETKQVDGRAYTLTRDQETGPALELPGRQKEESLKILRRLYHLLTLEEPGILGAPSWKARAVAVMDAYGVQRDYKKFCRMLDELLEDSNKYFGNWQADPERKIIVGAGA